MNFEQFQEHRRRLRSSNPGLIDLAETNVYRSLPAAFPELFGPIPASPNPKAAHRCHFAELVLHALGLAMDLRPRLFISHGVRRSLFALFRTLAARNLSVLVPSDVYPRYLELSAAAALRPETYPARSGLPPADTLRRHDAILICDPLKPWGGELSPEQLGDLATWSASGSRLVIIDSAYAFPPRPQVLHLATQGHLALLGSLSKHWLIPDHGGFCLLPQPWADVARPEFSALPKDDTRLRVAFAALESHPDRPTRVESCLHTLRAQFERRAQIANIPLTDLMGYFATTPRPFDQLASQGILAIPPSVFGSTDFKGSILSTLATPAPTH